MEEASDLLGVERVVLGFAEMRRPPALLQQGGLFSELVLSAENGVSSPVPEEATARSA